MAVKTKKIDVNELTKGMYISKLDRPWINTSFPLEGFCVKDSAEIKQITAICRHVYIDVERTRLNIESSSNVSFAPSASLSLESTEQNNGGREFNKLQQHKPKRTLVQHANRYVTITPFEKEFTTAKTVYNDIVSQSADILKDISTDKQVSIEKIKHTASAMVSSMLRNPDAFLWLSRLKTKDTMSHTRSIRAAVWAIAFGRYLGLDEKELNNLSVAVLLANIGKSKLPKQLLQNEDRLNEQEFKAYKRHIHLTLELLNNMQQLPSEVKDIVAAHCERYNGSGYPNQLVGKQIPFLAQITGMLTYFERLTNRRESCKSLDSTRAIEHLFKQRDGLFMADLIDEFIQSVGIYPAGSLIELNSREVAVIVEQNEQHRLLPKVMILRSADKKAVSIFKIIDLAELDSNTDFHKKPKIINSLPIGSYGISAEEIMEKIDAANAQNHCSNHKWSIKKLFGNKA